MIRRVQWPRSADPLAWVRCTAEWALTLGRDDNNRCYLSFAIEALAARGERDLVEHYVKRLLADPPREAVSQVLAVKSVVRAALLLGDEAWARAELDALLDRATTSTQNDGYVESAVEEIRLNEGLLLDCEFEALEAHEQAKVICARAIRARDRGQNAECARLVRAAMKLDAPNELMVTLLIQSGERRAAKRVFAALPRRERMGLSPRHLVMLGETKQALEQANREARKALRELTPTEWNLHFVAGSLRSACTLALKLKQRPRAERWLTTALNQFDRHRAVFDSRGFASAGAYVALSQVAAAIWSPQHPRVTELLERALAVPNAQLTRADVALAHIELGAFDRALEVIRTAPRARQASLRATLHFRARQWSELQTCLSPLRGAEAARVAWSFTSQQCPDPK